MYSRYRNGEPPEQVALLPVADTWITHLAFSAWDPVQPGYCKMSHEKIEQFRSYKVQVKDT